MPMRAEPVTPDERDQLMDRVLPRAMDGDDALSDDCLIALLKLRRPGEYLEEHETESDVAERLRDPLGGGSRSDEGMQ